jgi:molybdopterin-binding protein
VAAEIADRAGPGAGRAPAATTGGLDTAEKPALTHRMQLSARNQLKGKVAGVRTDGLMAEVTVAIGDQELTSIITRASAERLGLRGGDEVTVVIKSTEVMLAK